MYYPTYSALLTEIQEDLDLTNENLLVTPSELLADMNKAIKRAEQAIHTLNHEDKYFQTSAAITLAPGQPLYNLPANIYANKMRKMYYLNGDTQYEITKMRLLDETLYVMPSDPYKYLLVNPSATLQQIQLWPTPQESGNLVTLYYVREANQFTNSLTSPTNVLDIPEAANYLKAYCRWMVAKKSKRQDWIAEEKANVDEEWEALIETLNEFVLDENNKVILDLSSYENQEMLW